jgi:hypothetical protein
LNIVLFYKTNSCNIGLPTGATDRKKYKLRVFRVFAWIYY